MRFLSDVFVAVADVVAVCMRIIRAPQDVPIV